MCIVKICYVFEHEYIYKHILFPTQPLEIHLFLHLFSFKTPILGRFHETQALRALCQRKVTVPCAFSMRKGVKRFGSNPHEVMKGGVWGGLCPTVAPLALEHWFPGLMLVITHPEW
jgi:hypothetical protein